MDWPIPRQAVGYQHESGTQSVLDMKQSFIKNHDLIKEESNVEDLFEFSDLIRGFSKKIDTISRSAILGLVGPFGIGKSTLLYNVQKHRGENYNEQWISFDAWKHPDRKDLWEGFVLETANQLGVLKKISNKIAGRNRKLELVGGVTSVFLKGVDKLFEVLNSPPAKRVFELQDILTLMLNKNGKKVIVTIEDIDRSGDSGIYFLETLKQYIRSAYFKDAVKLIAIVPISDKKYKKHRDSYHKCLDFKESYNAQIGGFTKFVDCVFDEDFFSGEFRYPNNQQAWTGANIRSQIISYLEELYKQPEMTPRNLKMIIRNADNNFGNQVVDGFEPDLRVTICFESAKYFYADSVNRISWFDKFKKDKEIPKNTIQASFLGAMIGNRNKVVEPTHRKENEFTLLRMPFGVKLIRRPMETSGIHQCPSWPWHYGQGYGVEHGEGYGVCDFYLNY